MHQVEVLARRLAHEAGEVAVQLLAHALARLGVQAAEDVGRAHKGEAGEPRVLEDDVGDGLRVAVDKLDHVGGEPGLEEDLVHEVAGVGVVRRRLPHHDVAHDGWPGDEVAANSCEVEGGDGVDEAFKRSPVGASKQSH